MGKRRKALQFVCKGCGKQNETWNTGNKGIFCDKKCRADFERNGPDKPWRYIQNGYWMLQWTKPDGKKGHIFEHRKVWQDANGPIQPGFEIHHINEDKLDNQLGNLLCVRRKEHKQFHRLHHTREEELAARARQQRECRARRKMAE